ncbi:MAG: ABC transporter permease [Verrucomicrobia bacterium]|nr:ABC transporter permease [Verrucomicrobiota bacterium]
MRSHFPAAALLLAKPPARQDKQPVPRVPSSSPARPGGSFCKGWTLLVLVFLYAPIAVLVAGSFNASRFGNAWEGFTLRWYGELARNQPLLDAAWNSLVIAAVTTVLSVALGTLAAWLLHRHRFPGASWLALAAASSLVTPEIIMGVSLLVLFAAFAVPLGFTTVIIAHTTFCFPFVMVAVQARLAGMDASLEEAALDLGATPAQAFRLVIAPCLMPAIVSGALMAFTLSLDELVVTYFTAGPDAQTLPVKILGLARVGLNPVLNAVSTVFIVTIAALVVLGEMLKRWRAVSP